MKNKKSSRLDDERGMALVIALMFSLILLMLATTLIYSMTSFFRSLAVAREKSQSYYVAASGVEKLRDHLWQNNCIPPNWCGQLGVVGTPGEDAYQEKTAILPAPANDVMAALAAAGVPAGYRVFLRDNDDGDGDFTTDSDQIIVAVASGSDSTRNVTLSGTQTAGTQTTIEAMLLFTGSGSPYAQLGAAAGKSGKASESVSAPTTIRQTL
ncbi:MAG: hypothetical protein OHK006_09530 [Thermodesulfovibrionales bacterium]